MTGPTLTLADGKFTCLMVVVVLVFVILAIYGTGMAVSPLLPESWAGTAGIRVESDERRADRSGPNYERVEHDEFVTWQSAFDIIHSPSILSNVVNSLDLRERWGKKYNAGTTLSAPAAMAILNRRTKLHSVSNTLLILITTSSDDRVEAADLANAVVKVYQNYRWNQFAAGISNNLAPLENQYHQQELRIERLQSEMDALAGILALSEMDSPETLKAREQQEEQVDQDQLSAGKQTCAALETELQRLQAMSVSQLRDTLPAIAQDDVLTQLLEKLNQSGQKLALRHFNNASNDVHSASTINELNTQIDARMAEIMAELQSKVASRRANLTTLQMVINESARENLKRTQAAQPYWEKKNDLAKLLNSQKSLQAKINGEKELLSNPPPLVEITDLAQSSDDPVKVGRTLTILIGAILSVFPLLVAGYLAIFRMGPKAGRPAAPRIF